MLDHILKADPDAELAIAHDDDIDFVLDSESPHPVVPTVQGGVGEPRHKSSSCLSSVDVFRVRDARIRINRKRGSSRRYVSK